MAKKTPLYEQHQQASAKFVDFFGWEMPLHYGSQSAEHHTVRQAAGMFDVSHMTIVDLLGAGGRAFLRYLLANDIDRLSHQGKALYSCMLNEAGRVLDDLIVYYRQADNYRLVLNASTREKDLAWIEKQAQGFSVGVQQRTDLAMLAVQGPQAIAKLSAVLNETQNDALSTLQPFESVEVDDLFIGRTGYTGEDGVEIILPIDRIAGLWQQLLAAGVTPCGLGARDTLRLEAGLNLYGNEMDEHTSPLEANLAWTIAWSPEDRNFIGRNALELQRKQKIKQKLVGLVLQERGVLRKGQKVVLPDGQTGIVTSGTFSPTLQCAIALARVPVDSSTECQVEIRGKLISAKVVRPRFVKQGQTLID
ncbi:MAG: glycine cleavage system aminomethyltransferase GcvT [Gammaproteobacteria bacterium]